eukprot:2967902-Pyramimonas_sp.AAC.1
MAMPLDPAPLARRITCPLGRAARPPRSGRAATPSAGQQRLHVPSGRAQQRTTRRGGARTWRRASGATGTGPTTQTAGYASRTAAASSCAPVTCATTT